MSTVLEAVQFREREKGETTYLWINSSRGNEAFSACQADEW